MLGELEGALMPMAKSSKNPHSNQVGKGGPGQGSEGRGGEETAEERRGEGGDCQSSHGTDSQPTSSGLKSHSLSPSNLHKGSGTGPLTFPPHLSTLSPTPAGRHLQPAHTLWPDLPKLLSLQPGKGQ